jgi:hypothetical protein
MTAVACSDGSNGLITRYGWQTQGNIPPSTSYHHQKPTIPPKNTLTPTLPSDIGQIPRFPYIGASDSIAGWNSGNCGQCLSVSYGGKTIYVLAVDHADAGLVLSTGALNDLTNGQAVALGVVDAQVQSVDVSNCGLAPAKRFFRA